GRRLLDRELGVGLGDQRLAARVVVVALVELVHREVVVRLRHRELDRRAALGAAVARGRDQLRGGRGLRAHLAARAAAESAGEDRARAERGQPAQRTSREHAARPHAVATAARSLHGLSFAGATGAGAWSLSFAGATSGGRSSGRRDGSLAASVASSAALLAASVASRPNRLAPWKSACAATSCALWRYCVARVHQYGAYLSAWTARAAATASVALRVTSPT